MELPDKTILNVTLPNSIVLFDALVALKDATPKEIDQIRDDLLFKVVKLWLIAVGNYTKLEYREDPELLSEHLLDLIEYGPELAGLADTLHRKMKSNSYLNRYQEIDDKTQKTKHTHDVREYYARVSASEIEGIVSTLEAKTKYLYERLAMQKGKFLKGY